MRPRPTPDSRKVAAAVMAVVTSLTLAACSGHEGDGHRSRPKSPPRVSPTEQSVRGPAGAAVLPGQPLGTPARPATPDQPNLLMITMDDAARGDMAYMPHLERLVADRGVTLTNGMAPTPICVPARASLITGQYAHNHGATTISGVGGGYDAFEDADTLPVWLQDAGYDTMFIGKYLNGYGSGPGAGDVPPGWTDWRATEDPSTYNFVAPTINDNGVDRDYDEYSSYLFRDLTDEMLSDPARQQKPWYLWVNYVAPHHGGPDAPDDPSQVFPDDQSPIKTTTPAPEDDNAFDGLPLPDKPDMFEKDVSDKELLRQVRVTWSKDRRAELTEARQQRIESLQAVDRSIAETMTTLRDTGQLDDTYVVVTSDNGYVTGEHNLDGKLWYFHDIVGVPMYVRGPGLPAGTTSGTPVTNADWAPTFAALAGATPTRDVDGVDVLPWLSQDAPDDPTRAVPIEAYPVDARTSHALYTGVVAGPWTYVRSRTGRTEAYYRTVDPFENHSIAHDPRYRAQVKELAALTRRYADCAGADCPADYYR